MPIYEYECNSCGHILDALQKMSEDPLKFCPECGEPELKRLLSAPRFRLKGSGWYETDFKSGDRKRNLHGDDKPPSENKSENKSGTKKEQADATSSSGKADTA